MTDCSNVEVRELLPDYLHELLAAAVRVSVERHLAQCATCREELAALRLARAVMSSVRAPSVDVAGIVRALPRPVAPSTTAARSPARPFAVLRPSPRRTSTVLRIAAVVTFVSLGGISVAVTRAYFGGAAVPPQGSQVAVSPDTPTVAAVMPSDDPSTGGRTAGGVTLHSSWHDLDDAELESLMGALDDLEAVPLAEPETIPGGRALDGSLSGS